MGGGNSVPQGERGELFSADDGSPGTGTTAKFSVKLRTASAPQSSSPMPMMQKQKTMDFKRSRVSSDKAPRPGIVRQRTAFLNPGKWISKNQSGRVKTSIRTSVRSMRWGRTEAPTIILLGEGGGGKSTIAKQIKLASEKPIAPNDMASNVSAMIKSLVSLCDEEEKGVSYNVPEHVADLMDEVTNINARGLSARSSKTTQDLKAALCTIWNTPGIRQLFETLVVKNKEFTKFMHYKNAKICLEHIDRVFDETFALDSEAYGGIYCETWLMSKTLEACADTDRRFQLVDIGGKLHFRAEWTATLQEFKGDGAILYIASLPDYSWNDQRGNRLVSCLASWVEMLEMEMVAGLPVVLILNKEDVFAKIIETQALSTCSLLKGFEGQIDGESIEDYKARCLGAIQNLYEVEFEKLTKRAYELFIYTLDATNKEKVRDSISKVVKVLTVRGAI